MRGTVLILFVTLVIRVAQTANDIPDLDQFLLVNDFEKYAEEHMDKERLSYLKTGAMLEQTLLDNRQAFSRYRLQQSVLQNTLNLALNTTLLGTPVKIPIGISPTAYQQLEHPDGENATARAAAAEGTIMILSGHASISLEEVAKSTRNGEGIRWFQTLNSKNRSVTIDLMKRAEAAGFKAIVLTVDEPVLSFRITSTRAGFSFDDRTNGQFVKYGNSLPADAFDDWPTLTWKDIPTLKRVTELPIILKGIITGRDADLAVRYGADAILVSNQGGRQLDGAPATLDALPDVIKAVKGRIEVYMDGGIRTGSDVFKALALGARAVFIGRPNAYGLYAAGEYGSRRVLHLLKEELQNVMHLTGVSNTSMINQSYVRKEAYYRQPLFRSALYMYHQKLF